MRTFFAIKSNGRFVLQLADEAAIIRILPIKIHSKPLYFIKDNAKENKKKIMSFYEYLSSNKENIF